MQKNHVYSFRGRAKVACMSALRTKRRKIKETEDEARYQQRMHELKEELAKKDARDPEKKKKRGGMKGKSVGRGAPNKVSGRK